MYIPEKQPSSTEVLPTMYDLLSENPEEPGLPDVFHLWQPRLLSDTCRPPNHSTDRILIASDLNLYYDRHHFNWYKRPDWFVVVGVSKLYQERDMRLSYVIWQEKVSPMVVVELLSPGTEDEDFGMTESSPNQPPTKWQVYERILKIPYYFVFSRYTNQLRAFRLTNNRYREQVLTSPRVWIPELQLGLGLRFGDYENFQRQWLRWYDADGNWVLTPEERERQAKETAMEQVEQERLAKEQERLAKEEAIEQVEQERLAKEQERLAKEEALKQSARLAERLRAMGINPDEI